MKTCEILSVKEKKNEEKKVYVKPEIRNIVFNTQSTTVLGNCSGWKGMLIR